VVNLIEGVILAGGKSSRMKQNKMMLDYKGQPLITHVINSMFTYCNKITIVTGHYQIDYKTLFDKDSNIDIIHNESYELGMFSSIKKGIEGINSDIFIIPGDYPLVKNTTYKKLLDGDGLIRVPVFRGRKGHPIFISQNLLDEIRNEDINSNLKVWRDRHSVQYIEVDDEGVIKDIDNINEYTKLLERND